MNIFVPQVHKYLVLSSEELLIGIGLPIAFCE